MTTHLVATRAPPQKKLDVGVPTSLNKAIHGYSFTWQCKIEKGEWIAIWSYDLFKRGIEMD